MQKTRELLVPIVVLGLIAIGVGMALAASAWSAAMDEGALDLLSVSRMVWSFIAVSAGFLTLTFCTVVTGVQIAHKWATDPDARGVTTPPERFRA